MASFFFAILPIFIVLLVSLIVPIIIVLKWQNRPVWALMIATCLYMFPFILVIIYTIIGGYSDASGLSLIMNVLILLGIYLLLGLFVLIPIQWQSRRIKKRRFQANIDKTF